MEIFISIISIDHLYNGQLNYFFVCLTYFAGRSTSIACSCKGKRPGGGGCDAGGESHGSESVYKPSPSRSEAERPAEVEEEGTGEGGFLCGVLFVSEQEDCGRTSLHSEKHSLSHFTGRVYSRRYGKALPKLISK